jgi:hypothetical protein
VGDVMRHAIKTKPPNILETTLGAKMCNSMMHSCAIIDMAVRNLNNIKLNKIKMLHIENIIQKFVLNMNTDISM